MSNKKYHERVLDPVPVRNKSSKTITASCKFSDTVSVKASYGVKVSASVQVKIMDMAEAQAGVELQASIEMSASSAREAIGTFKLKPHQAVVCERTFGYYSYTVAMTRWYATGAVTTKKTAHLPYSLGATFVDG